MPILVWLIEQPEDLIVVDTGETARGRPSPAISPAGSRSSARPARMGAARRWGDAPELRRLGFAPDDVRWVVLAHFHTDHVGGLAPSPRNEIWSVTGRVPGGARLMGQAHGFLPSTGPTAALRPGRGRVEAIRPFPASARLTRARDVTSFPRQATPAAACRSPSRTATRSPSSPATPPAPRPSCSTDDPTVSRPSRRGRSDARPKPAPRRPAPRRLAPESTSDGRTAPLARPQHRRRRDEAMSEFETAVSVQRAMDDVFTCVSDPLNMPHWYSAVQTSTGCPEANHGPAAPSCDAAPQRRSAQRDGDRRHGPPHGSPSRPRPGPRR